MPDVEALLVEPDVNAGISKVWLVLDVRRRDRLVAHVAQRAAALADPHLRWLIARQRSEEELLANDDREIAAVLLKHHETLPRGAPTLSRLTCRSTRTFSRSWTVATIGP